MLRRLKAALPFGRLAVVPFSGAIFRKSVDDYLMLIKALESAKNIKGVMLELESPGGGAAASEMLHNRLRRLNEKKPLYCYTTMAASGGYMAAVAARRVCAPSTAVIGSIGVISVKPVIRELMERLGVKMEVTKKGAMKDMSLFHREATEEELKSLDALHEDIYERFIEMVAEGRKMDVERIRSLATGELFSARRALELGLIDATGDFDGFMEELSKETGVSTKRVVVVKPRKPLVKRLMGEGASALVEELRQKLY